MEVATYPWNNSVSRVHDRTLYENILHKGKSSARYVYQTVSKECQGFRNAHPAIARYSVYAFFWASVLLICFYPSVAEDVISYAIFSICFFWFVVWFVLVVCCLVRYVHSLCARCLGKRPSKLRQELSTVEHEQVTMEKPPEYESLPPLFSPPDQTPAEAPPTYEEMLQNSPGLQAQLPHSGAVCVGVPLCPVHQAGSEHQDTRTQRTRDSAPVRSKSLVNLYESDRDSLVHLV